MASTTAKSEKSRNSSGWLISPRSISVPLRSPFRPRNGIHEIMRMMLEVRNGTVQTRKRIIRMALVRTWKARK